MTAHAGSGDSRKTQTGAYKDKSKPADIRSSNINAAKGRIASVLYWVGMLTFFAGYAVSWKCSVGVTSFP